MDGLKFSDLRTTALSLGRRCGESVEIEMPLGAVKVTVLRLKGSKVTLRVESPRWWTVMRSELRKKAGTAA
jgi:sRNA-binding carbon storage regulator CsrA